MNATAPRSLSLAQARTWYWRGWRVQYAFGPPLTPLSTTPMLWLHGFGASQGQWRSNLAEFQRDRPLYTLDLLGFGGSHKAATRYSIDLWVDQVYAFWQTWIGQPLVLVGHSLGALVALRLATRYPVVVERLVLFTLPAARQELLPPWLDAIAARFEQGLASPLWLKPLFQLVRRPAILRQALRSIYLHPDRVDADLVNLFYQPTCDRGAARAFCYLVESRTEPQFSPTSQSLLAQLTTPTLLLWGTGDRVIPIHWGRQVAAPHPAITWVEIPHAGHCSYDECPAVVNATIQTWLDTVPVG